MGGGGGGGGGGTQHVDITAGEQSKTFGAGALGVNPSLFRCTISLTLVEEDPYTIKYPIHPIITIVNNH